MKRLLLWVALLLATSVHTTTAGLATSRPVELKPQHQQARAALLATQILTQYHYKAVPLDDSMSARIFDNYLKALDPDRQYFLQSDVDHLSRHRNDLDDAIAGADVFVGLSGPNLLSPEQLLKMADKPIVFAGSNPDPEIRPEVALATRSDVLIATGRSDYPNQVNNVLGFPFIFRGALDVRAAVINTEMKMAAVKALCEITKEAVPDSVVASYGGKPLAFGRDYILPKPTDPRLLSRVSAAVARAAVDSGAAHLPYPAHYPL